MFSVTGTGWAFGLAGPSRRAVVLFRHRGLQHKHLPRRFSIKTLDGRQYYVILIDIVSKKQIQTTRKPTGIPRLVRLQPHIDAWLIEKTKKDQKVYYVQELIRDILQAAYDAERKKAA